MIQKNLIETSKINKMDPNLKSSHSHQTLDVITIFVRPFRMEKEKQTLKTELDEKKTQIEDANKAKLSADKVSKQLESQAQALATRIDELNRAVSDLKAEKQRAHAENAELLRQLGESELAVSGFAKVRQQLQTQVKARRYSKRISSVVLLFYCLLEQFCEV